MKKGRKLMDAVSSTETASTIQADYMKLLVAQLRNQNPLEPLDNNEMASQLAQFSQLQQLESMNSNFAKVLSASERSYANSLIGKEISFLVKTEAGDFGKSSGTVAEVFNDPEDGIILKVNGEDDSDYTLRLDGVISVRN